MFKSFVLLLCLSLAVALPITREGDDSSTKMKGLTRSSGSHRETVVHGDYKPYLEDDEVVYLVRRGKKKKNNPTTTPAEASGSGASGSGTHHNQPAHPPQPATPATPHQHPHGTPQQPQQPQGQHPHGQPNHPPNHPATPGNTATTPAARPPTMSWANVARLAVGARQAARRVTTRRSPPPFANTPDSAHAAIMTRVNNRRERNGQLPFATGNVAHAFVHNGRDYHLIRNDNRGGLQHIDYRHGHEFDAMGAGWENRGHVIERAIRTGRVVASQNGRPIYEFQHQGGTHHVAITTGEDGYIVGANMSSAQDVAYYQNRARNQASGSGSGNAGASGSNTT